MRSKQNKINIHDLKVKTSESKVQCNFVIDDNDELFLHFFDNFSIDAKLLRKHQIWEYTTE